MKHPMSDKKYINQTELRCEACLRLSVFEETFCANGKPPWCIEEVLH